MEGNLIINSRESSIDFLKLISINIIIAHHCAYLGFLKDSSLGQEIFRQMWIFVDLFFVIAGFLFTRKLWLSGCVNWTLLGTRYLRILPIYLIFMVFGYLGKALFSKEGTDFHFSYLFLLQNYLQEMPFYGVSWFLCVLEQVILVIFLAYKYLPARLFPLALALFAVTSMILRLLLVPDGLDRYNIFYRMSITHSEGVLVGGLISIAIRSGIKIPKEYLVFAYTAVILYIQFFPWLSISYYNLVSYSINALVFGILLLCTLSGVGFSAPAWVQKGSQLLLVVFLSHPIILQVLLKLNIVKYTFGFSVILAVLLCWIFAIVFQLSYGMLLNFAMVTQRKIFAVVTGAGAQDQ